MSGDELLYAGPSLFPIGISTMWIWQTSAVVLKDTQNLERIARTDLQSSVCNKT